MDVKQEFHASKPKMNQMKKFLTAALITATALVTTSGVNAQTKIGYISTQELVSIMPERAKADSNLQQYRTALIQNAQEKQSSLESAIEDPRSAALVQLR